MNPSFRNISAFILAAAAAVPAAGSECYARLDGDTLRMGNDRIERVFLWNDGNLKTVTITDKASGRAWPIPNPVPDFAVNRSEASGARLDARLVPSDGIRPEHLEATVGFDLGSLSVRRVYRIYDGVAAIAVDTYLRGRLDGSPAAADAAAADRGNIESKEAMKVKPVTAVLDRVNPGGNHWHGRAVEFRDISDWNNNLVDERDFISYRKTNYRGNVLLLSDGLRPGGFVLLKEAPCSGVQLAYKNADFIADFGSFAVTGLGLESKDVTPDRWTRAYGSVLCTYDGSETEALKALRGYQKQTRILDPSRDEMVMMNTWGDRSQDAKVNEAFCLAELDRASRLGISLFQIDDGWQVGKSPNSAVAKGSFRDMHRNGDYWKPDPKKYPRGLRPVVEHGRRLGIEVGLWYNPSIQDDFADWQKDADNIIGLYRDYGIRMFKIDGLTVTSKLGEENLRRLFDRVLEATDNAVMFNLDATASRRCGYHYFNEYGNVFLENRYTDWGLLSLPDAAQSVAAVGLRGSGEPSDRVPEQMAQRRQVRRRRYVRPRRLRFRLSVRHHDGRSAAGLDGGGQSARRGIRHPSAGGGLPQGAARAAQRRHPARWQRAVGHLLDRLPVHRVAHRGLPAGLPRGHAGGRLRASHASARGRGRQPDSRAG